MARRETNEQLEFLKQGLEKVKPAGKGWIARCPAHDDNEQSLSIAVGRNGNVLINCFIGCNKLKILNAMGLKMEDLFANGPREGMTREEKNEAHIAFMQAKWMAALTHLRREAMFLDIVARALAAGETVDTESQLRLQRAVRILDEAWVTLSTGPNRPRIQSDFKPTDHMLEEMERMSKKSGWKDDQVPSARRERTTQPRPVRHDGRGGRAGKATPDARGSGRQPRGHRDREGS